MENSKLSFIYSWAVIIFMFIIFWPIGLCLLIIRFEKDRTSILLVANLLKIVGWVLIVIAALGIIALFGGTTFGDFLIWMALFGTPGVLLLYISNRIKKKSEKFKRYIAIIVNGQEYMLDHIASATHTPYDIVKKDLQEMINKNYFSGAYINESTREIIIKKHAAPTAMIKCSCCGANNLIVGNIGECEYCGSKLTV